jgi:hypothetical protein
MSRIRFGEVDGATADRQHEVIEDSSSVWARLAFAQLSRRVPVRCALGHLSAWRRAWVAHRSQKHMLILLLLKKGLAV